MIQYQVWIRVRNPRTLENPWNQYHKTFDSEVIGGLEDHIALIEANAVIDMMESAGLEAKIMRIILESKGPRVIE